MTFLTASSLFESIILFTRVFQFLLIEAICFKGSLPNIFSFFETNLHILQWLGFFFFCFYCNALGLMLPYLVLIFLIILSSLEKLTFSYSFSRSILPALILFFLFFYSASFFYIPASSKNFPFSAINSV